MEPGVFNGAGKPEEVNERSKPKVLFVMHMPPPVHGAAMMGKYIRDSRVVNEAFECRFINLTTAKSLKDVGRGGPTKWIRFARLFGRILREARRFRPDLVYVTPNACGRPFYKDFMVVQALKALGLQVVVHYHNKGVSARQDHRFDDKLYRRFFKGLKVILLAEVLYEDVKKYVRREDVFICPNGIPRVETLESDKHFTASKEAHESFSSVGIKGETPEEKCGTSAAGVKAGAKPGPAESGTGAEAAAPPRLLFLSNLIESKGVLVLLDACKMLRERGYSFVCDFVGAETSEINASRFAAECRARCLSGIVTYKGCKYGAQKHEALDRADIFVFPTYSETFGLVNLEAMEHALPVVSTDEGGIREVVRDGENGFVAKKGDPESLAGCIARLLDDPGLRARMGADGLLKFNEHFTLQAFEERITSCIRNCYRGGVKLNLVFFHGPEFGASKAALLAGADIFVFPSFYSGECFPLVLLEAMRQGLPCISTSEGGIPEIFGVFPGKHRFEDNSATASESDIPSHCSDDESLGFASCSSDLAFNGNCRSTSDSRNFSVGSAGIVCKKQDPASLADAIACLLDHPALRLSLGASAKAEFNNSYTLSSFESRFCSILSGLVSSEEPAGTLSPAFTQSAHERSKDKTRARGIRLLGKSSGGGNKVLIINVLGQVHAGLGRAA